MEKHVHTESETVEVTPPRFREFLALFLRNKWIIVSTAVAVMFLVGIYTLQKPATFEGTAMVLINMRAGQQANPFAERVEGSVNKLANEISILKTRILARQAAEQLLALRYLDSAHTRGIPILLRDPRNSRLTDLARIDTIMARLQLALTFIPERESDIIRIIATSEEPGEASLLANTYAYAYRDQALQQSRFHSRSLREFLEGRLAEQRVSLTNAEAHVKTFMESSGMVSLDGESNRIVQELSQLEATRNSLSIEIESLTRKLSSIRDELPVQEKSVLNAVSQANDPYIRMLREQVAQIEVERDVIIARNDPAVLSQGINQDKLKDLETQIASLRAKLRTRTDESMRGIIAGAPDREGGSPLSSLQDLKQQAVETRFQLDAVQSRRSALNKIITEYEDKFHKIPRQSVELARLQRERLSTERLYGLVEEKYHEAAITEKSEYGNVEIVDLESPETVKGKTSLLVNLLLGFVAGLVLGIGGVMLKESLDVRVRTPEQLERFGFPAIAEIPVLEHELKTLHTNGSLPPEASRLDPRLHLIYNPMSYTAESYRRLRTALLRRTLEQPLRIILVTSPNPGEGKTTTLLNLALSRAETEHRTLVIDADLRRPMVHTLLGLSESPGLSDVALGKADLASVIHRDVVPCLDVITSGTRTSHPSHLFGRKAMLDAILRLKEEYTWILLDGPPALVVNDAAVLSSLADATLIMVSAGETRLEALRKAAEIVQKAGNASIGIVLGKFDPRSAYGAYYGGNHYGHYDSSSHYYRTDGHATSRG